MTSPPFTAIGCYWLDANSYVLPPTVGYHATTCNLTVATTPTTSHHWLAIIRLFLRSDVWFLISVSYKAPPTQTTLIPPHQAPHHHRRPWEGGERPSFSMKLMTWSISKTPRGSQPIAQLPSRWWSSLAVREIPKGHPCTAAGNSGVNAAVDQNRRNWYLFWGWRPTYGSLFKRHFGCYLGSQGFHLLPVQDWKMGRRYIFDHFFVHCSTLEILTPILNQIQADLKLRRVETEWKRNRRRRFVS